jgi:hypothetical protein
MNSLTREDDMVSKEEEMKALEWIRKKMINYAIMKYNSQKFKCSGRDPNLTTDIVNKNLKKSKHNRTKDGYSMWIEYTSVVPGIATFVFFINQEYNEDDGYMYLSSGFENPIDPKHFSPVRFNLWKSKKASIGKLKENVGKINTDYKLTKEEEQRALQYIRNEVFPLAMDDYVIVSKEKHLPIIHYGPELDGVRMSLKKFKIETFTDIELDRVIYTAQFKEYVWTFLIEKYMGHVRAGYVDDFFDEPKLFDMNFSVLSPRKPNPKQTPKPLVGYVSGKGVPPGPITIKETISKSPDSITKEDVYKSLQFIRNLIYRSYQVRPKNLKRVEDKTPSLSFMASPNPIRFSTDPSDPDGYFNFVILKIGGKIYIKNDAPKKSSEKYIYPLDYTGKLIEKALL